MPRFRDLEAFVAPYSANVDQTERAFEDVSLNILDDTILFCRTTLASGFYWGMTNPARQWRQWTLADPEYAENAAVKEWLHIVNERAMTILSRSNFYETMSWVYDEWPTFGTAVVLIEEDERDVVRYVPWGIGSYAIADDDKGNPIALSRKFPMTVRQVVERFATRTDAEGRKAVNESVLSENVKSLVKTQNWETTIWVYHLICPNDVYVPSSDLPEDYAFASYYWEDGSPDTDGDNGFLAKEGYREWPAMVFRWKRVVGDPWGTDSPGILTLGSNKSLQQMESDLLMAVEKQVKPPLVVPPELTVASLLPAAKNAVATARGQMVGPLHETNPVAIQIIAETQEQIRQRVQGLWYTRLMLAFASDVRGDRPTAREVEEVSQEKYLVLGRPLEQAGAAFKMASEREFAIMERRGLLPPIPPELDGQPLTVEYTSVLAVAQKAVGLSNLERFGMQVASVAQATGNTAMLQKVDWDQWVDEVGNRSAVPPRTIRPDADVARMRRAEADAIAQQQQVELAAQEAKAVKDLAQAPVTEDNALGRVLNATQATPI